MISATLQIERTLHAI